MKNKQDKRKIELSGGQFTLGVLVILGVLITLVLLLKKDLVHFKFEDLRGGTSEVKYVAYLVLDGSMDKVGLTETSLNYLQAKYSQRDGSVVVMSVFDMSDNILFSVYGLNKAELRDLFVYLDRLNSGEIPAFVYVISVCLFLLIFVFILQHKTNTVIGFRKFTDKK